MDLFNKETTMNVKKLELKLSVLSLAIKSIYSDCECEQEFMDKCLDNELVSSHYTTDQLVNIYNELNFEFTSSIH